MNLTIVNPLEIPEWNNLVAEHEDATIFHTSNWARVLFETYRYNPKYFVKFNSDRLSTLLPLMEIRSIYTGRRAVSLPFTDFCPLLNEDERDLTGIMEETAEYGRRAGWKRIEFRGLETGNQYRQPAVEYFTHDLALTSDIENMSLKVRESALRNARKALRKGVTVKQVDSLDGLRQYFTLNRLTRKRHGIPPQPFSFFESIYRNIISRGLGTVFLAYYQDRCIAGVIFFHFNGSVLFKFGASDSRYHYLGTNNQVMWEAIKSYTRNSYRTLNFGRTDLGNTGLRRFKMSWGPTESKIRYHSFDLSTDSFVHENNVVKNWQRTLLKRTPVPVLGLLGSWMYRHIG